jgi:hypothetical protein
MRQALAATMPACSQCPYVIEVARGEDLTRDGSSSREVRESPALPSHGVLAAQPPRFPTGVASGGLVASPGLVDALEHNSRFTESPNPWSCWVKGASHECEAGRSTTGDEPRRIQERRSTAPRTSLRQDALSGGGQSCWGGDRGSPRLCVDHLPRARRPTRSGLDAPHGRAGPMAHQVPLDNQAGALG